MPQKLSVDYITWLNEKYYQYIPIKACLVILVLRTCTEMLALDCFFLIFKLISYLCLQVLNGYVKAFKVTGSTSSCKSLTLELVDDCRCLPQMV